MVTLKVPRWGRGGGHLERKCSVSTGIKMPEVVGAWEHKAEERVEEKQPLPFKKISRTST